MSDHLHSSLEGPVARITLDRPPLNVLTTAMMVDLADALERAGRSETVRVLRLDAVGKVYSAGVDVGEHEGEALRPMMEALGRLFETFDRLPVPTISVVHAEALGGGCELVLGTDLCLASDRASFGLPEVRLGLFAPPASVLLPRIIGQRRALAMLLTGEAISAAEAEAMGLVNRVFPASRFSDEVDAWIGRLVELSGAALRHAKEAVLSSRDLPVGEAHRKVIGLYLDRLMETEDAREGPRAFMEKRAPSWRHR